MARRLVGILLFLALAVSVACSSQAGGSTAKSSQSGSAEPAQEVTVEMSEFAFAPLQISVKAGAPVKLTVENTGTARHDWTMKLGSETVKVVADPGQTRSVTFMPKTPGTYEFICSEPGHEPAGMKGTLTVS